MNRKQYTARLVSKLLIDTGRAGITLEELVEELIDRGLLPETSARTIDLPSPDLGGSQEANARNYDRWTIPILDLTLNKRRTVLAVVRYLVQVRHVSVDEINDLTRLIEFWRPVLLPIADIVGDLENRYFIRDDERITINGVDYGILNQWGGDRFENLIRILNERYELDIQRAA